jgi:hypothetical protein
MASVQIRLILYVIYCLIKCFNFDLFLFSCLFLCFLDLLYKDYNTDQKFTLSTYTSDNVVRHFPFHLLNLSFEQALFFNTLDLAIG